MYTVYTTENCIFCTKTKNLLNEHNCEYINVILDTPDKKKKFKESTGHKTIPQIYTDNGIYIGGYEDLVSHMHKKMEEDISIMEDQRRFNRDFDTKKTLVEAKKRRLALKDRMVNVR